MTRLTFLLMLLCMASGSFSQKNQPLIDSLKRNLAESQTEKDKLHWMGELVVSLGEFDTTAAQVYADEQLRIAEASRNRRFMMDALYSQLSMINLKVNASQSRIDQAIAISKHALEIAKESNDDEYQAWSFIQLSNCYSLRENNKSVEYAGTAVDIASSLNNDSLSVYSYLFLGDALVASGNKIAGFRNYLKAYNISESGKSVQLKIAVYLRLADFHGSLRQWEKQKDYLIRGLDQTRLIHNRYWECFFLSVLGQVIVDQENYKLGEYYLNLATKLADSLQYDTHKVNIYWSLLYLYKLKRDYNSYLQLLKDHPEIDESFSFASGNEALDKIYRKAVVLKESEHYDSAVYYYRQIEKVIGQSNIGTQYKKRIYLDFGGSLIQIGDYKSALAAYKNAELYSDLSNPIEERGMAKWFDTIYRRLGEYKLAYAYKVKFDLLQDSLDKLSKQDELLMKEIDNETQRNEKIKADEEERTRRRHNIQYMGITVSIIAVFTILIMMGFFSLSIGAIQALGFFAFLLLFEFIILLADNMIHSITHGEPWKVLLIKIGIAAILLPLHHFVEEKAIHYFSTRKKIKMDGKKFLRNIYRSKNKRSELDE